MFSTSELIIPEKVTFKKSMRGKTEFDKSILPFMSEGDFLCSVVEYKSQLYKCGQIVMLQMFSPEEIKVGKILSILVKKNSAYLVTNEYVALKHDLQYFHANAEDATPTIKDVSRLVDFKPITNHGTATELFFCLHHHLSYRYP